MTTEDINPRFADLDRWDTLKAAQALHEDQVSGLAAIRLALPAIAAAVDAAAPRLRRGGRLIYAGAGTSARIGVQDGAELLPTFGWPADRVAFAIAGGEGALLNAVENAEDSGAAGEMRIAELNAGPNDVVIGVAASGATPYTIGAIKAAKARGALTIGVSNNPGAQLLSVSDCPILVETGAEAVAGSTRLKAGTAQKVALNLFSTLVMVRLNKVYRGLMVHMQPTNEKLRKRAARMVAMLTDCDPAVAENAVAKSGNDVKTAVLIALGLDATAATTLIEKHDGNLRAAMAELPKS